MNSCYLERYGNNIDVLLVSTSSLSSEPMSSNKNTTPPKKKNNLFGHRYSQNDKIISVHFQGKPFNIMVIQVYAPTSNAEEAEVEWFCEDLLELTPKKDVLFIIGDWNAKVGSQETPAVTGKFGLGVQYEAGQRLIEFCQENALVIANTLFQ